MTPIERFQALLDGKKLRLVTWDDYKYIHHDGHYVRDQGQAHFERLHRLFNPDEKWALYEEPKPEIKLTRGDIGKVILRSDDRYSVIIEFDPVRNYYSTSGHWFNENGHGVLGHTQSIIQVYR